MQTNDGGTPSNIKKLLTSHQQLLRGRIQEYLVPVIMCSVCATDPNKNARALLRRHSMCPRVLESLGKLMLANASDVNFNLVGYMIHVPLEKDRVFYANFWKHQALLIEGCYLKRGLTILQI